jgi:hypothetical protein
LTPFIGLRGTLVGVLFAFRLIGLEIEPVLNAALRAVRVGPDHSYGEE